MLFFLMYKFYISNKNFLFCITSHASSVGLGELMACVDDRL